MENFPPEAGHPFHPADPPKGMQNYDLGALSRDQKKALNRAKMNQRKENEIYLSAHPEIKGFISILLRYLLRERPQENIHEVVGGFYNRERRRIAMDVLDYLEETGCSPQIMCNIRKEFLESCEKENAEFSPCYNKTCH